MNDFGFIVTRHVNSETTNKYWNHSIKLLRFFYPTKKIVIIDDNSDTNFLKADYDYINLEIIQSEFPGRGELLPYYYYIKNKFFDNAIIIHDSVFFHKRINFEVLNGTNVLPLWYFNSDNENKFNTLQIINNLKNKIIIEDKFNYTSNNMLSNMLSNMVDNKWYGCFGCQSYINHKFLLHIENKYNISNLTKVIINRPDRCCLERIMGCIFSTECYKIKTSKSLLGNICNYPLTGKYNYNMYDSDFKKGTIPRNVVKIWTGR
jgi:hypothetical protein